MTLDLGGAGSGNFGHGGRPGEVGGSSSDGASQSTEAPEGRDPNPADASHVEEAPTPETPLGKERPTPIVATNLGEAVDLILKGKVVELKDVGTVHTVLSKLAEIAQDAKAKGKDAPYYDLCNVSVAGTNLFCGSLLKTETFPEGVPRVAMPQFTGKAIPGSAADALPKSDKGNVSIIPQFMEHLAGVGIAVKDDRVPASGLKATQAELVGETVASMMTATKYDPGKQPIFVSSDGYVLDGHHRWAAVVGRDAEDGKLGQSMMNVRVVDAPMSELLMRAKTFTEKIGMDTKAGATALSMIFGGSLVLLPFREKLLKLSERWDADAEHI